MVIIFATIAMFVAVLGIARMAANPSMSLLYSQLDAQSAGQVIAALDQQNAPYEVRGNAIYVNSSDRDSLRMQLASGGLPANGAVGYELLDGLTGFGTTSQMFDAAYWRAKEGELARTIVSSPLISSARVHIAHSGAQPFRDQADPSASVTLIPASGSVNPDHARALRNLVASAVSGLTAENVSIINGQDGRIIGSDPEYSSGSDRAAELKTAIERMLVAHVGQGNAVVEVSVETETERQAILERIIDPNSRVAISSDTEESNTQAQDSRNTQASVASNLPDGDAADGSNSTSQNSLTRERVNFDVSETQREIVREPGAIRKVSVAVLIDGIEQEQADGTVQFVPRGREELDILRGLVASTIGFDESRGDSITIESLLFEPSPELGTSADAGIASNLDMMKLIQLAALIAVALILGLFVVRPILTSSATAEPNDPPLVGSNALSRMTIDADNENAPAPVEVIPSPNQQQSSETDPVTRLRELISERQSETVEVLRHWMEEGEERI